MAKSIWGGLFGGFICVACWIPFGFLIPKDQKLWAQALASTNNDLSNRIRDLQQPDVKAILEKLKGKCVNYGLNARQIFQVNYWDKSGDKCNWKDLLKSPISGSLTSGEFKKLEKICKEVLWKNLAKSFYDTEHIDKKLARYNVCLNFAVNMHQNNTK